MAIELSSLPRRLRRSKIAWLIGGYTGIWLINRFTTPYTECITDSWCISSREDTWVMSALPLVLLFMIWLAALIARRFTIAALASPHRHWYACGFFVGLGSIGLVTWFLVVPPVDRLEFIHIPIISAFFAGIGGLMFRGLNPNRGLKNRKAKRQ